MNEIEKSEAFTALQKVRETEEKARKIIADAREKKASDLIQKAYEEAKEIRENAIKKAKEEKKILEINAYYDRLDLDEFNAREANKKELNSV